MTFKSILAEARKLPYDQRVELVDLLQCSIMTSPEYKKVQAAQAVDLHRRLAEIEAGKAKFISGDEVVKRLRRRNGKKT